MFGFQGLDDGMTANFRHSNASFGVRQADGVGNAFDDVLLLLDPFLPRTQNHGATATLPSEKRLHNYGKSPLLMGKSM
jgi:hypothetical protein